MMDTLRQYILSVITAAFICGILSSLTEQSFAKEWMHLICGSFMVITIISPLLHMDFVSIVQFSLPDFQDAQSTAYIGEQTAKEALAELIIKETEAYILDKALSLQADIAVEISLDSNQLPVKATLRGAISPQCRQKLENILVCDLGITKENQVWTG